MMPNGNVDYGDDDDRDVEGERVQGWEVDWLTRVPLKIKFCIRACGIVLYLRASFLSKGWQMKTHDIFGLRHIDSGRSKPCIVDGVNKCLSTLWPVMTCPSFWGIGQHHTGQLCRSGEDSTCQEPRRVTTSELLRTVWFLSLRLKLIVYQNGLVWEQTNSVTLESKSQYWTKQVVLTGFAHRRCRQGERIKERDACDNKHCWSARARARRGNVLSTCKTRQLMQNNDKITRKKTRENPAKTNVFQALHSQNPVNTNSFCFPEVQKRSKTMLFTQFSALGVQKTP